MLVRLPNALLQQGMSQATANDSELNWGLPCGRQGPNSLGNHLLPSREPLSKKQESEQEGGGEGERLFRTGSCSFISPHLSTGCTFRSSQSATWSVRCILSMKLCLPACPSLDVQVPLSLERSPTILTVALSHQILLLCLMLLLVSSLNSSLHREFISLTYNNSNTFSPPCLDCTFSSLFF